MTIRAGQPWGRPGRLAAGAYVAEGDRALARHISADVLAGRRPVPCGVSSGDLARTLGLGGPPTGSAPGAGAEGTIVLVDALAVSLDGTDEQVAVAHAVARRSWWRGEIVVAMNAEFLDGLDAAPRSHPNDGRVDVMTVRSMRLRDRIAARRRLPAGLHVPHPAITEQRVATAEIALARAATVWLDGEAVGRAEHLRLRVIPDAFELVIVSGPADPDPDPGHEARAGSPVR